MIAASRGENCITTTKSVLAGEVGRQISVAGIGQIAVRGPPNKSTFSLGIVPAGGLTVGNNRRQGLSRCLLALLWRTRVTSAAAGIALVASPIVAGVPIAAGPLPALSKLLLTLIRLISVLRRLSSRPSARPSAGLLRQLLLRVALGRLR
jgi:hypothetical protein